MSLREGYGLLVANALAAVRQLHADTSRLLQDCDGTLGKGKVSKFGNYVTHELTYHVRADYWMADTVYRYYYEDGGTDGVADAVSVCFFDEQARTSEQARIAEPFLLVGQIKYRVEKNTQIATKCEGWDLWRGYFEWWPDRKPCEPHAGRTTNGRVEWFRVVGVPLFSVQSLGRVEQLMAEARGARPPAA